MIALAVRLYVRYCLSSTDVVESFADRGLVVDGVPSIGGFNGSFVCLWKLPSVHWRSVGTICMFHLSSSCG